MPVQARKSSRLEDPGAELLDRARSVWEVYGKASLIGLGAALQWPGGARQAILGVALGSGLLWLLAWGYWRLRKVEGMGGGDIKLAAMFGVVIGWKLTLLTLFLASLAGSLWGGFLMLRRLGGGKTALPFGTLLAPAAMVSYLWGERWVEAYLTIWRR